tara:strand:+ start:192 stop:407 length:216 start_codon:yes stop_codon:yes gene_type:complete
MDYTNGSIISIKDERGRTYIGKVALIYDDMSQFDEQLEATKGFILYIQTEGCGGTYDILGYDSQVTEVLWK